MSSIYTVADNTEATEGVKTMNQQQKFEKYWCDKYGCSNDDYWFTDGVYGDSDMQLGWELWQAAIADVPILVEQAVTAGWNLSSEGYNAEWYGCTFQQVEQDLTDVAVGLLKGDSLG